MQLIPATFTSVCLRNKPGADSQQHITMGFIMSTKSKLMLSLGSGLSCTYMRPQVIVTTGRLLSFFVLRQKPLASQLKNK